MKYIAFVLLILGAVVCYGSKKIASIDYVKNILKIENEEDLSIKSGIFKIIGFIFALVGAIMIFNI